MKKRKYVWLSATVSCGLVALVAAAFAVNHKARGDATYSEPDKKCVPVTSSTCTTCESSGGAYQCSTTVPADGYQYGGCAEDQNNRCYRTAKNCGGSDQVYNCADPPVIIVVTGTNCGSSLNTCKSLN